MTSFNHMEAFCHMKYGCMKCGHSVTIWNSRDGAAPYGVTCERCGSVEMVHVDWSTDVLDEHYVPRAGDKIFVSRTPKSFRERVSEFVEYLWKEDKSETRKNYVSKDAATDKLFQAAWVEGMPELVTVGGMDGQRRNRKRKSFRAQDSEGAIGLAERR